MQVHLQVLLALQTSATMDELLYETDALCLAAEDAQRLRQLFLQHSALVSALQRHFVTNEGRLLFNVTFKLHWLDHAVSRGCFISPRSSPGNDCEMSSSCLETCSARLLRHRASLRARRSHGQGSQPPGGMYTSSTTHSFSCKVHAEVRAGTALGVPLTA